MIKFQNIGTNEIKTAYSVEINGEWAYVRFSENGKIYKYCADNIEVLNAPQTNDLVIYTFTKECWKCHQTTEILTYITYMDNPYESAVFPWDKPRFLMYQDIMSHMEDSSIEYYGLNVIGTVEEFDSKLMKKYPDKIKVMYSKTEDRKYPMNICEHCGAHQGRYFVYRTINEYIKANKPIPTK